MLCMQVSEEGNQVVFLRKVKEGITQNSYGIHVASLAGIPVSVIERAKQILSKIQEESEANSIDFDAVKTEQMTLKENKMTDEYGTPGLFSDEEIIISEILSTDLDNMTPISALQTISRWKKTLSGR